MALSARHWARHVAAATLLSVAVVLSLGCAHVNAGSQNTDTAAPIQTAVETGKLSPVVVTTLQARGSVDALITLDDSAAQAEAARIRQERGLTIDTDEVVQARAALYEATKVQALAEAGPGVEVLERYPLLPVLFVRVTSMDALAALAAQPEVTSIRPNELSAPAGTS